MLSKFFLGLVLSFEKVNNLLVLFLIQILKINIDIFLIFDNILLVLNVLFHLLDFKLHK